MPMQERKPFPEWEEVKPMGYAVNDLDATVTEDQEVGFFLNLDEAATFLYSLPGGRSGRYELTDTDTGLSVNPLAQLAKRDMITLTSTRSPGKNDDEYSRTFKVKLIRPGRKTFAMTVIIGNALPEPDISAVLEVALRDADTESLGYQEYLYEFGYDDTQDERRKWARLERQTKALIAFLDSSGYFSGYGYSEYSVALDRYENG